MIITILVFVLILSVLVLVHELGHFLVAKKLKVKVEEFGIGFPPRIWGKKVGETMYSVNLLPIGGFVKLYGEDDAGAGQIKLAKGQKPPVIKDLNRAFFSRSVWQRGSIVIAGVVMNFLLAVVILSFIYAIIGVTVPGKDVFIANILAKTPAEKVGIKPGDTIISVNGQKITSPKQVSDTTKKNLGKEMLFVLKDKSGKTREVRVTPRITYPKNQGAIGIAMTQSYNVVRYPWYQAPFIGVREATKQSLLIVEGIGTTLFNLAVKQQVPQDIAGPVGIAQLTGEFIRKGAEATLSLVALLSLNLAVLNVLPIPALDGGRLFFIVIEAITRRKVNAQFETYAHTIGMILLLGLIVLITFHDVIRLISGQPLLPKM